MDRNRPNLKHLYIDTYCIDDVIQQESCPWVAIKLANFTIFGIFRARNPLIWIYQRDIWHNGGRCTKFHVNPSNRSPLPGEKPPPGYM